MQSRSRPLLPSLVCLTLAVAFAAPGAAAAAGNVQAKPIGDPIWKPTDLNLFTAPIAVRICQSAADQINTRRRRSTDANLRRSEGDRLVA